MKFHIILCTVIFILTIILSLGFLYKIYAKDDASMSVRSEEERIELSIGSNPSLSTIQKLYGKPNYIYPGDSTFKSELYYDNLSPKVALIVYVLNDNSIRVGYMQKN